MVPNPHRQPSSQAVLADHTGLPLVDSVLNKSEIAKLLSVPVTWVATHSGVIPGTFRLGRKLRFRRIVVEEWLGGTSPLLNPEEVSEILRVNTSWVYAHADQIPGVMRLGYYVRFKPSTLVAFLNGTGTCQ
jgi:hypothetical protein